MACRGYYVDSFSSVLRPTPDGWPSSLLSRRSSVFHNAVEEAAENGGGPRLREATKKKITGTFPKHFQSVKRLFAFFFVLPALRVTSAPCGPGGPCCGTVPTRVQCVLSLSLSLSLCLSFFFFRFASEIFISGQPAEHLDQWPVNNWRVVRSVALDGGPRPRRRRRPRPRSMP